MSAKVKKIVIDTVTFIFLTVLSFVFITPIATVVMNSFKKRFILHKVREMHLNF